MAFSYKLIPGFFLTLALLLSVGVFDVQALVIHNNTFSSSSGLGIYSTAQIGFATTFEATQSGVLTDGNVLMTGAGGYRSHPLKFKIYSYDGSWPDPGNVYPTSLLSESNSFDPYGIASDTPVPVSFTFSNENQIDIFSGTKYYVSVECDGCNSDTSWVVRYNANIPSNDNYYQSSATWNAYSANADIAFKLNGDPMPTPTPTPDPTPTPTPEPTPDIPNQVNLASESAQSIYEYFSITYAFYLLTGMTLGAIAWKIFTS